MIESNEHIELTSLLQALRERGAVILLESQSWDHPSANSSYLAALPESEMWAHGRQIYHRRGSRISKTQQSPWDALKQFYGTSGSWLFGYLGYDLKNYVETLESNNNDPVAAPDLYMMNPGLLIKITPDGWQTVKGDIPPGYFKPGNTTYRPVELQDLRPGITEEAYREMIRQAKNHIAEGDYYEINLTHQMRGKLQGEPLALYNRMKQAGPVPFGAYLSFGNEQEVWSVCCASPERFLARRGARVFSQPIKGTVRRGETMEEDQQLKNWLAASEKNRAENLMIVDLVRNDLARVARKGTVKVSSLFELQTFKTVHQMVSTIEAESPNCHPVDIIRSCFPMGSMTGAPKISAMQSIEELENYRRGIYSGSVGYLTPGGDFDFNVVIRTAIMKGSALYYSVGGAITSDSSADNEWDESHLKAKALTSAISAILR